MRRDAPPSGTGAGWLARLLAVPFALIAAVLLLAALLLFIAALLVGGIGLLFILAVRPAWRGPLSTQAGLLRRRAGPVVWRRWPRTSRTATVVDYEDQAGG